MKKILNTLMHDGQWRSNSFPHWWQGPVILVCMLLLGYLVVDKSPFFHSECPPAYYRKSVLPLTIKAKVINIKGNTQERHNWLTWILLNNDDTFNLIGSEGWGDLINRIAINDLILKAPGKLDLVLVKASGESKLYKYVCPE